MIDQNGQDQPEKPQPDISGVRFDTPKENIFSRLKKTTQGKNAQLAIIAIMMLALPLTVLAGLSQQEVRQRASEGISPISPISPIDPIPTATPTHFPFIPSSRAYIRVFVTDATYTGDLRKPEFYGNSEWTSMSAGTEGADQKCQQSAETANLGGTWKAWTADKTNEPYRRFAHAAVPYKLLSSAWIASNWLDLTDGTLNSGIYLSEKGNIIRDSVWTGTDIYGRNNADAPGTCVYWQRDTGNSGGGSIGLTTSNKADWTTTYQPSACSARNHLYCFEQAEGVAVIADNPTPTMTPKPTNTPIPPSPTPTPNLCTPCNADVTKNGKVTNQDYNKVGKCVSKPSTKACAGMDVNRDGKTDIKDLNCVVVQLNKTCSTRKQTSEPAQ